MLTGSLAYNTILANALLDPFTLPESARWLVRSSCGYLVITIHCTKNPSVKNMARRAIPILLIFSSVRASRSSIRVVGICDSQYVQALQPLEAGRVISSPASQHCP